MTDKISSRVDLNAISNSTLTIGNLAGRDIRETHFHLPDSLELTGSRLAPRNPLFVGRAKLLAELAERLKDDGALVVLVGYGGLGKTQTAVEFGHRYASHFPGGAFFLNCARADSVSGEIATCGSEGRVNFPGYDGLPLPQQLAIVQREWAKPIPRLIIMDNAEEAEIVKQWRPASGGCRLLVTARRATWPPSLTPNLIHLPPLDRPDSLKLLAQGSEAFANDSAANAIADSLGDLPLALHCAGAYMAHYGQPPADYLAELKAKASTLQHESLGDWLAQHESLPTGHTPNAIATFELSYQALTSNLKIQTPNSKLQSEFEVWNLNFEVKIFHLLAHCAPAVPLPREVLMHVLNQASTLSGGRSEAKPVVEGRAPETITAKQLTDALRELSNVGLIDLDGGLQPIIHRLPQEFARLRAADPTAYVALMEKAVAQTARKINEAGLPDAMGPLREHLRVIAERAEAQRGENAGGLFNELGYHLQDIADYAAARATYERALAIDEKSFGPNHPNVARDVNNLGLVYKALGNLIAARAAFERALTISEKAFGPNHPNIATLVNNLGTVYQDLGDLPAARAAFERALATFEQILGAEHPNIAIFVNNLGGVYQALGDLPAARAAFERALTIDEKAFGPDHPNIAGNVNNLGGVYQALGDLPAARAAFERALTIDEKTFGPDHPNVARDVNNLGVVHKDLGDLPAARAAFERALTIDEKAFGPDHPNITIRVNNLGVVHKNLGDLPAARAAFERALTIEEKAFGPDHPNVASLVNNLSLVYKDLGDLPAACAALERALATFEKVLGAEHPNVATLVNNLGLMYKDLGDLPAARVALERALAIDEKAFGPGHPNVARDVNNLGLVFYALGDLPTACAALARALKIYEKYAPNNPGTKTARENLARVVKEMED